LTARSKFKREERVARKGNLGAGGVAEGYSAYLAESPGFNPQEEKKVERGKNRGRRGMGGRMGEKKDGRKERRKGRET
jgi:hypothetical protein